MTAEELFRLPDHGLGVVCGAEQLDGSDVLDGEPLFPGFRLPVADILGLTP